VKNECSRRDMLKATAASLIVAGHLCKGSRVWGYARSAFNPLAAQDAHEGKAREGAIEFESSNTTLVDGFRWAKRQALAYARTDGSIGPWYEASLAGRNAFCMRDVSHQSTGAQFLGLGPRTLNMLRRFAANISAAKKWCTWWEITRDNQPAPADYNHDHDFWYDLPANFDVVDACYRQWLWSRDSAYLDHVFLNFYRHTVTDYVAAWSHGNDGLLEHMPSDGHMGIGTYDEDLQDEVLVGSDLIAAQYAAYRRYAAIAHFRGEADVAAEFDRKADRLKELYNSEWWDSAHNCYFGALGEDGKFHSDMKEGGGRGTLEFPLYYELTAPGPRIEASLKILEQRLAADLSAAQEATSGVEGRSYMADIFYMYGRSSSGYSALMAMMDPALKRREYPEVSYTAIGNLGSGLMGIRPSLQPSVIETFPQLTADTNWAALHHIPTGENTISVKHVATGKTEITNQTGPELTWHAGFPVKREALTVNGKKAQAQSRMRMGGVAESYCEIPVKAGETCVVEVPRA